MKEEKRNRFKCPYQDSNLGRRGIALPQHDDLTTNLYGPEVLHLIPSMVRSVAWNPASSGTLQKKSKRVY